MSIADLQVQLAAAKGLVKFLSAELKRAEKDAEAAIVAGVKPKKPQQPELAGMPPAPPSPPREKSIGEKLHATFHEKRGEVFQLELQVPLVQDEFAHPAFINTAFKPILEKTDTQGVEDLMELFFMDPWAAGLTPPYPFRAFVSPKTWPRLLADSQKNVADQKRANG